MTETTDTTTRQEAYAAKIAKLLRQAEGTKNEAEAEAFFTKAQELMTTWAIDEEMLDRARGDNRKERDKIVERHIEYTGIYSQALYDVGRAVAIANDCKVLIRKRNGSTTLYVIGFEKDVDRVRLLDSSLQIQAVSGMKRWWTEHKPEFQYHSGSEQFRARRQYIFGFARGVGAKLQAARTTGEEQAVENEAERHAAGADPTTQDHEQAKASVELVLRSKREQVNDWMDQKYGTSLRRVSRRYSSGSARAGSAGYQAGQQADVGQSRVGTQRSLPRG